MIVKAMKMHEDAILPTKAYLTDMGFDLYCHHVVHMREIGDEEVIKIHTGIRCSFPAGWGAKICDRSGMAAKGYHVVAGIIDNAYTGEICVLMHKALSMDSPIPGQKVAQMCMQEIPYCVIEEVKEIGETDRGSKGFGSTGYGRKQMTENIVDDRDGSNIC